MKQRHAAARHDTFLDGRAGRVQRIVDAILLLLHLDLGGTADLDHRDTAGELRQTLLQLLAVVVGRGALNLLSDLGDAPLDLVLLAAATDDRGVVLGDGDALGLAEHLHRDVLELDAEILGNHLAAGQDGDVLQHGLAAIAEAGRLHGRNLQAAAQLVDHERRKRLALDILGDDEQRPARLHHGLEQRQHGLKTGELLFVDQDVRVLELRRHLLGIGDEVGRDIAAVELHALDDFELRVEALGFLDGDHTLIADLLHGLGNHVSDGLLAIGRNRADLGDLRGTGDFLRLLLDGLDDFGHRLVDAALEVHRVHARGHGLQALADNRLGQDCRGRRAVASRLVGLRGDFFEHLRAHVLELVLKLDFLGHGDAVLRGARGAERLVDDDVAALRTERHLHRIGQHVDATKHALAGFGGELHVFCCH